MGLLLQDFVHVDVARVQLRLYHGLFIIQEKVGQHVLHYAGNTKIA